MKRTTTSVPRAAARTGGRLLLALAACGTGTAALWAATTYLVELVQSPARIDAVITTGVVLLGTMVATWYTLSAAVAALCLLARLTGMVWAGGEAVLRRQGAPLVRRLVTGAGGAALVAGSLVAPAHATGAELPEPLTLTWAPTETEPPGEPAPEEPEPPAEPAPEEPEQQDQPPVDEPGASKSEAVDATAGATEHHAPAADTTPASLHEPGQDDAAVHVVRSGETLWSIAAAHLGPNATDAQIAAAWPRWHQENIGVIGPDPDLILPDQALRVPGGTR